MGIAGLLPFVKNSCRPVNIRDFRGCTVAVDAYSWLHKGAFSCAEKIVKGEKTDGYVYYCIKQLNLLLDAGVKPILVFDGCNLESKAGTEKKRRENREKTKQRGKEFLCQGKIKEARDCFQRCVDVTPEMALEVIQACKAKNIDCIVAPYEADAQMAYMNRMNIVQIVITEDSDLIVFGCEKILFKMDNCGGGLLYEKDCLPKCFGANAEKMSFEKFRYMCILSGCDYLPSLPGIGLVKACKFVMLTNNPDFVGVLPKLPSYLKMPKLVVTPEYKESFVKAHNTFLYQLVFCPLKKALVPLNPYPEGVKESEMEYAGKYIPDHLAVQLAMGNINVKTMKEFPVSVLETSKDYSLGVRHNNNNSIWDQGEAVVKCSPHKVVVESSFKFKRRTHETSVLSGTKARASCNSEPRESNVDLVLQDNDLFSSYMPVAQSSPVKRLKKDSVLNKEEEESKFTSRPEIPMFSPFRKALSPNSVNVSKTPINIPFRKIVRSRFFSDTSSSCLNNRPVEKPTSLDSIDKEYEINSSQSSVITSEIHSLDDPNLSPASCNSYEVENNYDSLDCSKDKENAHLRVDRDFKENYVSTDAEVNILKSLHGGSFNDDSYGSCRSEGGILNSSSVINSFDESSKSTANDSNPLVPVQNCDTSALPGSLDSSSSVESVNSSERFGYCEPLVEVGVNNLMKHTSPYFNSCYSDLKSPQDVDEPVIVFSSSPENLVKKSGKILTRCRTIGLSKKRRSKVEKQLPVKDTLFNFNFTRKLMAQPPPV